MEPLNFKYLYLTLFFIVLLVGMSSTNAVDDCSNFTSDIGDSLSNNIINSNVGDECLDDNYDISEFNIKDVSNDCGYNISNSDDKEELDTSKTYSKDIKLNTDYVSSLSATSSIKTIISSSGLNMYYGSGKSVVAYLKTSAGKAISGKLVKITINGKTWNKTTDSNGKVSLKILTLTPKIYSTKFSFSGGSGYLASSILVNVTVKKLVTYIVANNFALDYNSGGRLVVTLENATNNPIKGKIIHFTINGKTYNKTTNLSGKAFLTISLAPNVYSCNIKFNGDSINSSSSKTINVTVRKLSTKIVASDLHFFDSEKLTAVLRDSNNNNLANKLLKFKINNTYFNITTDSNGKVSFNIPPSLKFGTYNSTISFAGDAYYFSSSCSIKIKVHQGVDIEGSDILSLASNVAEYIELNHKLPQNLSISEEIISIDQYLSLIASNILNIHNGNEGFSLLENISGVQSSENFTEGNLNKTEYIKLVSSVVSSCNWGSSPKYVSTKLGNVGFNSLIYILSCISKSYSIFGVLPNYVDLHPWSVVSSNKTVFININDVFLKADYLEKYVESKHLLPSSILINSSKGNTSVNLAQFLKLELDVLTQFSIYSAQSIILKNYAIAPNSNENISVSNLDLNSYYLAALEIVDFYIKNSRAPNYVITSKGNIGFESMIYIYSQILVSITKFSNLPSSINIVPWNIVKNKSTVFISMDDIMVMAESTKSSVISNHSLISSLNYSGGKINLNQFLYLEVSSIENINNCLYQSIILNNYSNPPEPSESITRGKLLKSNYLNVAYNIKNFFLNNNRAPNYAISSLGNISFNNCIFIYSEILNYFNSYGYLPDYVLVNKWNVLSNKNTLIFDEYQIINSSYYIVNYIETNHSIPKIVNIGGKSLNQQQILKMILSTIHLVNGTYAGSLVLDAYSSSSISDSLTRGFLNKEEYLNTARLIEYDMFYNDIINESTSLGRIGINNALYIYSQVLVSYDYYGILPEFINVKPWSLISNNSTCFISINSTANISTLIKEYIEVNNSLPSYFLINDNKIDMNNLAYILALTVKMINSKVYSNILIDHFVLSNNQSESLYSSNIDYESYLDIASSFINYMDKSEKIPDYTITNFGNVRYESLILLYSTVLDYYNKFGSLVENTMILPWNLINSSRFFNISTITSASSNLKEYIEINHDLPKEVIIDGFSIDIVSFSQILSESILNINGDLYSSIIKKNFNLNYTSKETINDSFDICLIEYSSLVCSLNDYFNNNRKAPENLSFEFDVNQSSIGFKSIVYLMSEILSSYEYTKELPEFLNFLPWTIVSNNSSVFLNPEDIINSSFLFKEYVYLNNNLPNELIIKNNSINLVQALNLYTSCIYNINFNIYQSVFLKEFNSNYSSYENIISGSLDYFEYISLVADLFDSFKENLIVSNLSDLSLGNNIGFNSLLLMEASILSNYSKLDNINSSNYNSNKNYNSSMSIFSKNSSEYGLPDEITIIPWIVIANPNKIYNYRSYKVFNSIQDAIDDEDTLDKDYIGVSKSNISESLIINKTIHLAPVTNYVVNFNNNSTDALIYLYSNNSTIDGFKFIGENTGIEIFGLNNEITNSIFDSFNYGIIVKGLENYIGFNEFNCICNILVCSNFTTIEANKFNFTSNESIKLINSMDNTILANIIYGDEYAISIYNSSANINFNSIVTDKGIYIDSDKFINLTNNWWGINNPENVYLSINSINNISYDSWLILSLDSFVDYSTKSIDTYDIILLGNLRYNNLNQDLSNEYILNDLNMEFKTSSGQISLKEFNELGYYIYTLKSPCSGDVEITLILDNQNITKLIYVPSNTSYGIINNRSGKSYYSIQEAIDSDDTKNGDTILLSRGIFTENIFIYKNITIKAKDIVYLNNFNNSKSTITIFSAGTTIDGLWISADEESYAASIYGVNINFINCNISNSMVGLYLMGSTNTSIVNCNFLDNEYGAYISFSDFSNFTNCSFIDSSYGIFGLENSNLTISKSEFVDCWISLDLINSNNTLIKNNNISKSYLGLELISSTTNLTNNIFIYNTIAYSVFNSSLYGNYNNNFLNSILADFASFDNSEIVIQNNIWSCGPASLATVLHKLGYTQFNQLSIINNTFTNNNGTSLLSLYSYLHNNDIKNFTNACAFNLNSSDLSPLDIVLLNISNDLHYSVIWDITENWVVLADSTAGLLNITRESFDKLFSSYTLVLNGSNSSFDILTVQEMSEIYGTLFDEAWNWLNTPMFYIPGYADFDKNYGVLGQGIKLAGWFLLGIDDDGGISPLNIGLDVISLCSGFGIAERLGVDAGTLVLKASNKFPEIDKFLKSSIKLKGLDFTITAESLFKGYKTSLSFLSNPFKLISTKTIDKVLDKYKYKLAYFAKNYLSSNIVTLSNVLGISKSYNNAKDNILFVSNLVSNFKDGKSINTLIAKSKSSIASTLKNTDNFIKSATSLAKKSVNIIVKSATSLNKKLSNYVTKAVTNVKNNIKKVKNTYKSVVNKVKSSKTYKALSKTYYAAKKVVYNAPKLIKKNIMNYTNRAIKSVTSFFNKIKFW